MFIRYIIFYLIINSAFAIREFYVDYENNRLIKDGETFRYVSASLHYFRIPHQYWLQRLQTIKASGANVVQTYIEWSSHEPEIGEYRFEENLDIINFLEQAKKADLLVIIRLGPYICAERDMGGLPYWLLREKPEIKLRTTDPDFLGYVDKWFSVIIPQLVPHFYSEGGPIIMMQVENEYGSFGCDANYMNYIKDLIIKYIYDKNIVLFTVDGTEELKCGKANDTLSTVDFGTKVDVRYAFRKLREVQPKGPLINSEFYTGWFDVWAKEHKKVSAEVVSKALDKILSLNASVNLYMFAGGTSFGLSSGAIIDYGRFTPHITSYDYDAPISERGEISLKYNLIREVIKKHTSRSQLQKSCLLQNNQKTSASKPWSVKVFKLFDFHYIVNNIMNRNKISKYPMTFEQLGIMNGFLIYSTVITFQTDDPSKLTIEKLNDRAIVIIDSDYVGTMSRSEEILTLPINAKNASILYILVENQGRISFGYKINEFKGIVGNVTLGPYILTNWKHSFINDWTLLSKILPEAQKNPRKDSLPGIYGAEFNSLTKKDTFMNPVNFHKGLAFINDYCLGRYWPIVGPQVTLYVPSLLFHPGINKLILFDLGRSVCDKSDCSIEFLNEPIINSTVPYKIE